MEDITLPLKEILDKGFPEPDDSKMIAPGTYKYIDAHKDEVRTVSRGHEPSVKTDTGVGFFFDGPFLPIRNGCCYTLHNLMRALAANGQATPTLINCFRGWDDTATYANQAYRSVFVGPADYYHDTSLIDRLFTSFDLKIAQFYNGEILLNIAPWLKRQGVKSIIEIQNIEHLLLERLGEPAAEVEKARTTQAAALKAANHVFCRSDIDRDEAIKLGASPAKVTVYKGGIYADDFEFHPRLKPGGRMVYLGHMYYQPNEDAVDLIVRKIMPELGAGYGLTVIGSCPPHIIEKYKGERVTFKQGIDDLSGELLKYDIAVAPLLAGSGTRLKLLDYLASGLPVITTSLGIEGLKTEIADYLSVEDDIGRHPSIVREVAEAPEKFAERAKQGRRFIEREYDWANCVGPFIDTYRKLIK